MALSDVTVTFDLADLLGTDFDTRRTKIRVYTNVDNNTLMDTSTGETRIGDATVTLNRDGTGSFTTWAPGADGNPISWQTYVAVDYPRLGARDRQVRTFGPYTITANADLTELEEEQAVPAEYLTLLVQTLQTYVDAAADAAEGFDIGDVDTGEPGSDATATITGTAPNKHLNLTIPRGNEGPQGEGLPGPGSAAWTATQAVLLGSVRQAPDGTYIKSTTARATRATFDVTEQGFWAPVSTTPSTLERVALDNSYGRIGAIDQGTKTSTVTLDALVAGAHEFELGGNVTATVAGPLGSSMIVRVTQDGTGGRTLTLTDVAMPDDWEMPAAADADETISLFRWATGWRGYVAGAIAPTVHVTPTAPTFTDPGGTGSDTYTIPTCTGVVYKVAGVIKAAGTYAASGTILVTAHPATLAYTLDGTVSWPHTFSTLDAYGAAVMADAPTTFLRFEGNATNDGSVAETYTPTGITYTTGLGDGTQCAVFDGSTSKLAAPQGTGKGLNACTSFTVEAIVKVTSFASTRQVGLQLNTWDLGITTLGRLTAAINGGSAVTQGSGGLSTGVATHIALRYDGTDLKLYVNGTEVATGARTGTLNNFGTAPPLVGTNGSANWFLGTMDGYAMYRNNALSPTRILAHAQAAGLA